MKVLPLPRACFFVVLYVLFFVRCTLTFNLWLMHRTPYLGKLFREPRVRHPG